MGGQGDGAQPAHHQSTGGEQTDLAEAGQTDGQTDTKHTGKHIPIRTPEPLEQTMLGQDPNGITDHANQRHQLGGDRRDGSTLNTKLGGTPVSKNQRVIDGGIAQGRKHGDPQHNLGTLKGGKIRLQNHDQNGGRQAPTGNTQIGTGSTRHSLILTQSSQNLR